MDYRDIQKLRAFFSALKDSGFKPDLKQIPSFTMIDGQRTPVDKAYCLELLRKLPQFQGDKFKDDNVIIKYLSDPNNRKFLLGNFTQEQQIELMTALEEKPIAVEAAGEQPGGQIAAGEGVPAQTPVGTTAGTMGMPGLPSAPSISFGSQRVIHNIPPAVKNFGSAAQIGIKKATTRLGSTISSFLGGVGRAAGGMLGGAIGGGGRALGRFGLRAVDVGANLSGAVSTRGSAFATAGRGGARWAVAGFLGFFLLTGLLTAFSPSLPSQPPPSSSTSASNFGLDYTLPIRDVSIVPQDLKTQVLATFPNAQIDNWDVIVEKSVAAGWNPALLLALWIEESGAQGAASYDDPLGCQPGAPTKDINISLNCVFNSYTTYTNDQFIEFMTRYGGGTPGKSLEGNANFPKFPDVVKSWYTRLVPVGPGAIKPVLAEALGCPTVGTITNPYGYNIPDQPDISYYQCDVDLAGCHSGIDIANGAGTSVSSVFEGEATVVSSDGTKGKHITISNIQTGYSATFEHLNSQIVSQNDKVIKGQVIGTMGATGVITGVHLHYRLEKNGKIVNPFRYLGSSASIAAISLIQSDNIRENNYQDKPAIFNWGQCARVP